MCNQNPYKWSVVESNENFSQVATLLSDYRRVVLAGYGSIANDTFGLNVESRAMQRMFRLELILRRPVPGS